MATKKNRQKPAAGEVIAMLRRIVAENGRDYAGTYALTILCLVAVSASTGFSAWVMRDVVDKVFYQQRYDLVALICGGIVVAFAGVYEYLVFTPLIRHIVPDSQPRSVDLSRWHDPYINGNVELLTLTGCLLAAAILGLAGALSRPRTP